MRLPTYEELASVEEQLEVLEWPLDEPLFVVGPPGSGKTVLAVRRAEMVSDWEGEKAVVVVTYNRMLRRLLDLLDNGGVKASTMHSYVWRDYPKRSKGQPVPILNDYECDWQAMLASTYLFKLEYLSSSVLCLTLVAFHWKGWAFSL